MPKIGIVTINDYNNIGNRLQNYAVQEIVKEIGFEVQTIVTEFPKPPLANIDNSFKRRIERNLKRPPLQVILTQVEKVKENLNRKHYTQREIRMREFTKKYINETSNCISDEVIPFRIIDEFDFFIVGSDQIWNPLYRHASEIDFLKFAPKNKRIAYAPSFGISEIPVHYKEKVSSLINEIPHLSVREMAGAKIIYELTGRESLVLLDPTMMLSKEKWISIASKAKQKPKSDYLVTYFLGKPNNETKDIVSQIKRKYGLESVDLGSIDSKRFFATNPSEFLDYINSAKLILTDSFHGTIFSIVFNKPFAVFERTGTKLSMNSRLDTLLSKFGLEERKWTNLATKNALFNIDYNNASEILREEQEKTTKFLQFALKVKEDNKL